MKLLHLTPADYKTSSWSGGTTTELFIYPENASYAKREFLFRISSAAVELPESDFTPLEAVMRYITPLSGGFTLTHPGKAPVVMAPLDPPYYFSGETPTHCVGTATDFNLMLKGTDGRMSVCRDSAAVQPGFNSFYAPEAGALCLNGQHYRLEKGDTLVVLATESAAVSFDGSPFIVCHVTL